MGIMRFDEKRIGECYKFLSHEICSEIRLIDPMKKKPTLSLFPTSKEEFINFCKKYNGQYNIYVGINERVPRGKEAKDVISVKTVVIDIDAVRIPGYEKEPATLQELVKAKEIAYKIVKDVVKSKQPPPVILASGNGYQLWFAIDEIPINDDNRREIEDKLQEFQQIIMQKYGEEGCIDKIGDLPRIIKVWGTLNIKSQTGLETSDRPFRIASLENDGERIKNIFLGKQILELDINKERIIGIPTRTAEINKEFLPTPLKYLLYEYNHKKPDGWMRIVEVFASFFRSVGIIKEGALKEIIEWSRKQPYRESNEEYEINEIVNRIYKNEIMCPNFNKLVFKNDGYPYFGLRSKFEGVSLGDDWQKYVNPVVYYLAKQVEESRGLKEIILTHLAQNKKEETRKASELIVKEFLRNNHIYTTKDDLKSEMWVYRKGIYIPNGKTEIKEYCRGLLEEAYTQHIVNEVISKIEADTGIEPEKLFRTDYKNEIPVQNGILDIFTRELKPFDPSKVFFNKLPISYNPKVNCNKIEKFLKEVLSKEDDIKVFYELGGFALLDEYKFEKAFMLVGNGRNGKGKTIELFKRVIGTENCTSVPLSSLHPESFSVSELFGKKLNLCGDISSSDLKDTSMFKALTGRDLVTGKRKFLRDLAFENYAKFVFACNELPTVYDMSKGFWDRWVLLEFPFTFVDKTTYESSLDKSMLKIRDEDIINKITSDEELSGLLNKFLDGLMRLLKKRRFSSTIGTEEIKDTWIRKSNSFIAFCIDNIEEDYDKRILKREMRKRYSIYCKKHKVSSKSDVIIKRVLQENYGASESRLFDDRVWEGVKWKNEL